MHPGRVSGEAPVYPGTDLAAAMSGVVGDVHRSRSLMPAGTSSAFGTRFDADRFPEGGLVFSTDGPHVTVGQMQDAALDTATKTDELSRARRDNVAAIAVFDQRHTPRCTPWAARLPSILRRRARQRAVVRLFDIFQCHPHQLGA